MSKIDIVVSRDLTINCGNYTSIKPSISLTVKDVEDIDIADTYKKMSDKLSTLLAVEIVALSNEMESAQEMGYKQYKKMIENAIDAHGGIDGFLNNIND